LVVVEAVVRLRWVNALAIQAKIEDDVSAGGAFAMTNTTERAASVQQVNSAA